MVMAMPLKPLTLDEVHRLPDDGNKYELVNGELFVTPPPTGGHETILARLTALLSARPERRRAVVVRRDREGCSVDDVLMWFPPGASAPLAIRLADVFGAPSPDGYA